MKYKELNTALQIINKNNPELSDDGEDYVQYLQDYLQDKQDNNELSLNEALLLLDIDSIIQIQINSLLKNNKQTNEMKTITAQMICETLNTWTLEKLSVKDKQRLFAELIKENGVFLCKDIYTSIDLILEIISD